MITRFARLTVAISLALQLPGAARAVEPLSFGILNAPPYGIRLGDGRVSGSNHDIAELIAAKMGLTFNYRLEPLARLIRDLEVGALDLMIMFPTEETKQFDIAELVPNNTVVLPKAGVSFKNYDDLDGKTLASLRGAVYNQKFAADEAIKKYDVDSYNIGLRMTQAGRVDGMIGPDFGLYYEIELAGMTRSDFGQPLVLNSRMLFLLGSEAIAPELAAKLKTAIEELQNSGAIAAVARKYVN